MSCMHIDIMLTPLSMQTNTSFYFKRRHEFGEIPEPSNPAEAIVAKDSIILKCTR